MTKMQFKQNTSEKLDHRNSCISHCNESFSRLNQKVGQNRKKQHDSKIGKLCTKKSRYVSKLRKISFFPQSPCGVDSRFPPLLYKLLYVLRKVNSLNFSKLRAEDFNLHKVYPETCILLSTLMSLFMKKNDPSLNPKDPYNLLPIEEINLGTKAEIKLL